MWKEGKKEDFRVGWARRTQSVEKTSGGGGRWSEGKHLWFK